MLQFSKHILCRQTCIQIYLSQIPYEDLRTNELSLCSIYSNNCTYQRKPSVVFVLLSFRETDHIQASWENFNYETKSLLTRCEMQEEAIDLFCFVSPTLVTPHHELSSVSGPLWHCFFFPHLCFPVHFSLFLFCVQTSKNSIKFHAATKMRVLTL